MGYPRILISLPIYKREWIVKYWLECIENQDIPLANIGFQFLLGEDDSSTHDVLWDWQSAHPECFLFDAQIDISSPHQTHEEGIRAWHKEEYLRMVSFRNDLLERASERIDSFDFYFSLDSDVLLERPDTLSVLSGHKKDVVSPLMFMKPTDELFPNSMDWDILPGTGDQSKARRNNVSTGLVKIDVPMAAVMMSPDVVAKTRYSWHPQGEDIGFAGNLYLNGFDSYIDYDLYTPHIMHRYQLADYLANGDPRRSIKVKETI